MIPPIPQRMPATAGVGKCSATDCTPISASYYKYQAIFKPEWPAYLPE
jgi:hypothetical protein